MRSKKNLVIGFLLLFLGIGLSERSLPLSILAGVAGIVMMILYAVGKLKRGSSEKRIVPAQGHEKKENLQHTPHMVSPQSLEPKQEQMKAQSEQPVKNPKAKQNEKQSSPFSSETIAAYQQFLDQYSQIVNADCFGTLAQIETKMQQCTEFLEHWMTSLGSQEFVSLLHTYDYFLLGTL